MGWLILIAISGILSGYILSKIENDYLIYVIFFVIAGALSINEFLNDLFEQYSYWIIFPILVHLLLVVLTLRFLLPKK